MGTSRAIGALLCVVCVVIVVLYLLFPVGFFGHYTAPLWIVLPVVIGILVLAGLGFWLGWIMFSTKEVSPPPPAPSVVESESDIEPESEKKESQPQQ
ncbi:MAG: hypothetical protein ACETWO_00540 [Candidatus Hadarchaeaceae archaeon]